MSTAWMQLVSVVTIVVFFERSRKRLPSKWSKHVAAAEAIKDNYGFYYSEFSKAANFADKSSSSPLPLFLLMYTLLLSAHGSKRAPTHTCAASSRETGQTPSLDCARRNGQKETCAIGETPVCWELTAFRSIELASPDGTSLNPDTRTIV
jgi:hypothetical protein